MKSTELNNVIIITWCDLFKYKNIYYSYITFINIQFIMAGGAFRDNILYINTIIVIKSPLRRD